MAQQRSRREHHRSGGVGDPPSTDGAQWRPFQIAFILVNLSGLADAEHSDREIADLLWFPTGGGKTGPTWGSSVSQSFFGDCATPGRQASRCSCGTPCASSRCSSTSARPASSAHWRSNVRSTFRTRRRSPSGSGSARPPRRTTRTLLAGCSNPGAPTRRSRLRRRRQRPRPAEAVPVVRERPRPPQL